LAALFGLAPEDMRREPEDGILEPEDGRREPEDLRREPEDGDRADILLANYHFQVVSDWVFFWL